MSNFLRLAMIAISSIGLSLSASAQTATQNINLNAIVADYCSISGTATGAAQNRTITVTSGSVDTAALSQVTVANVACSKVSDLTLTSTNTGLTGPAAAGGFQNVIHYTAAASFDGATPTLDTSATNTVTAATTAAATGNLTVDITPQSNASPMVAGNYSDVLVVTLTPQ